MYFSHLILKFWFPILSILLFSITAQTVEFTFGKDEGLLAKCLEYHLSKDSDLKVVKAAKSVAQITTHRFIHRSHKRPQFEDALKNIFYRIRDKKSYLFSDNKVPEHLKTSIREALQNCVERRNLPKFVNEPRVLSDLLDLILVDWPTPVERMIRTREDRSTLRLYAYATGVRLMSALRYFSMDYQIFRRELLRIWMQRAAQYYDEYRPGVVYIRHRFTTDRDRMYSLQPLEDIYTIDDINLFISRGSENVSDWNSVTSAENYLDNHLNQCYQIIFFNLELQLRGINTDEDDIYNGIIPYDVVPLPIQLIAWNGIAYRNSLISWHEHFEQFPSEELGECYSSSTIEELVIILTLSVVKKTASTTTMATTTMSTTSTEFPKNEYGLRKGGVRTRDCGKYFPPNKMFKTRFFEQNRQSDKMDSSFSYYGQIFHNGATNQLKFFEDQSFLKILTELRFLWKGLHRTQ